MTIWVKHGYVKGTILVSNKGKLWTIIVCYKHHANNQSGEAV
jgi:hypothetical protein